MGGLVFLLAAGHYLPVHPRPPPLTAAFHHLLQVLQCAGPQSHLQEPHQLTLLHHLGNFAAATTRLLVCPAARSQCREETRAWPGLPAAPIGSTPLSSGSWSPSWTASAWCPPWPPPQGSEAPPGTTAMFNASFQIKNLFVWPAAAEFCAAA